MALGERLKNLREAIPGLTQEKVADVIGVSRSSLNMYERGERDPDTATLSALARFYRVSADYLLGHTDSLTPVGDIKIDEERIVNDLILAASSSSGVPYEELSPKEQEDRARAVKLAVRAVLTEWERQRRRQGTRY